MRLMRSNSFLHNVNIEYTSIWEMPYNCINIRMHKIQ
jgi:hypothetical protein